MPPEDTTEAAAATPTVHPPEVLASIVTALDIASDEQVNIETAAEYLHGAHPGYFADHAAALAAIKDHAASL